MTHFKWAIANDHAAVALKNAVVAHLRDIGEEVVNLGTDGTESVDYPRYADAVVVEVLSGRCDKGILICGNGVGVSVRANRYTGIRASLVYNDYGAEHARLHGNANVLCFGERTMTAEEVCQRIDIYLSKEFEGGRHQRRIDMLDAPLVTDFSQPLNLTLTAAKQGDAA